MEIVYHEVDGAPMRSVPDEKYCIGLKYEKNDKCIDKYFANSLKKLLKETRNSYNKWETVSSNNKHFKQI